MSAWPFISPNDSFTHLSLRPGARVKQSEAVDPGEPDERGRKILIVSVDIGDGRTDEIEVHEYDEPEDLAKAFAARYGLSEQLSQALSVKIEANIEKAVDDQWKDVENSPVDSKQTGAVLKPKDFQSFIEKANHYQPKAKASLAKSYTEKTTLLPGHIRAKENIIATTQRTSDKHEAGIRALRVELHHKLRGHDRMDAAELTFSPQVITKPRHRGHMSEMSNPLLTERRQSKDLRMQRMRQDIEYQEQVSCPFKPTLSAGSRILMKKRSLTGIERADLLHKEAKELELKRKCEELSA